MQSFEQKVRQKKGREVIHAKHRLETIPGEDSGRRKQPGRVDQHVNPGIVSQENRGRGADAGEIAEICQDDCDRRVAACQQLSLHSLRLIGVATEHDDVGAGAGKASDGRQPYA